MGTIVGILIFIGVMVVMNKLGLGCCGGNEKKTNNKKDSNNENCCSSEKQKVSKNINVE